MVFKLVKDDDVPKKGDFVDVEQGKMIASYGPCIGTTGLGPCLALAAFGTDKESKSMMSLWHIDAPQITEFGGDVDNRDTADGAWCVVRHFKQFLVKEGMAEESIKIHVVGGPNTSDHRPFKLLFKDPVQIERERLGKLSVPFKAKHGYDGATEVYLQHPKTILLTFFCFELGEYRV